VQDAYLHVSRVGDAVTVCVAKWQSNDLELISWA
jgi:hypothetical protein